MIGNLDTLQFIYHKKFKCSEYIQVNIFTVQKLICVLQIQTEPYCQNKKMMMNKQTNIGSG